MTPLSQTIYSVALFFALVALWMWGKRRRRISRMVKRAVESMGKGQQA